MAHVGLRPQSVHQLGGYRVQRDGDGLLADARTAEQAGAFSIVLECIPVELADRITAELGIPTIGIGAGAGCDGQVRDVNRRPLIRDLLQVLELNHDRNDILNASITWDRRLFILAYLEAIDPARPPPACSPRVLLRRCSI